MTADDARALVEAYKKEEDEAIALLGLKIEAEIEAAARLGQHSLNITNTLEGKPPVYTSRIVKHLRDQGFEVKENSNYRSTHVQVLWWKGTS